MIVGQNVGYIRVSSVDQNEERQIKGIKAAGIDLDKIFMDKVSGKDTRRPMLGECLRYLREGDMLVCYSIDRLARNLIDLQKLVDDLVARGVKVRFVKEGLTFGDGESSPMDRLLLQVLGAFSQFERDLIKERQREGIELAKKEGRKFGRGRAVTPEQDKMILEQLAAGVSKAKIAKDLGIARQTLYNHVGKKESPAV